MALLFMDGFDHYATADLTKKWTLSAGLPSIVSTPVRRSGGALDTVATASNYVQKTLPSSIGTVYFGFAFHPGVAFPSTSSSFVLLMDGSTFQVELRMTSTGQIAAARNGTVLGTSTAVVPINTFSYIEAMFVISPTAGIVEVRLNGNATPILSLTGQNTRNSANSTINTVRLGTYNAAGRSYYDDFYICDASGSSNNNFLGDVRIDTLFPTADGTYSQFTPSTGTSHFALVDEAAPNTTDYNDGSAVGNRDSYQVADLSAITSQTIYAVQVNAAVQKDDAGAKSAAVFMRSGSTNADGPSTVLGTSQIYLTQIHATDPATAAAWTPAGVNAAEAGVLVTA